MLIYYYFQVQHVHVSHSAGALILYTGLFEQEVSNTATRTQMIGSAVFNAHAHKQISASSLAFQQNQLMFEIRKSDLKPGETRTAHHWFAGD